MKKILLLILLFINSLFAEVINEYPSQELVDSQIKIIDIRTQSEWIETGILEGALPITFFDERGNYNIPVFMKKLQEQIKQGEKFALICHVGNRTAMLAEFLSKEYHMQVVNLAGGMMYARSKGIKTVPFRVK